MCIPRIPPHQSSPAVVDTVTRGDFGHPELEPQTGTFREETTVGSASGEVLFKAGMIDPLLTQSVLQSEMTKIIHAAVPYRTV